MKSLAVILTYFGTFVFLYLLLSLFGIIWMDYISVLRNEGWIIVYSIALGWWLAIFPANEVYEYYY